MAGGLFDPLGTDRIGGASRAWPRVSTSAVVAAAALLALAALVAVAWLRDGGDRGSPLAVAPIERVEIPPRPAPLLAPPPEQLPAGPAPPAIPAAAPALPPVQADQDVEVQNGVRIIRPRRAPPAASPPSGPGQVIAAPPAR